MLVGSIEADGGYKLERSRKGKISKKTL